MLRCSLTEPIPRLIRFVTRYELPALPAAYGEKVVALLHEESNLLLIDKATFDELAEPDRERVLRTRHKLTYAKL